MNTQETPAPVRDTRAHPVNLGTLEDQEVLAWIGQFSHAGRVIERISERLASTHKRLALRFPDAAGAKSVARAHNILVEAAELLVDGSADLTLWLAEHESPADQDATEEPTPATESPKPEEPETLAEDDGEEIEALKVYLVRYAGEFSESDAFVTTKLCDRHNTVAMQVYSSKLDAERAAAYRAEVNGELKFEVLRGILAVNYDHPVSETRSVCVPAGTDPDSVVIPIDQATSDLLDENCGDEWDLPSAPSTIKTAVHGLQLDADDLAPSITA